MPCEATEIALISRILMRCCGAPWVPLLAARISPSLSWADEGQLNAGAPMFHGEVGLTTFRQPGYMGPRVLPGHGPHTYVFEIFALAKRSTLASGMRRDDVLRAPRSNVLGYGELQGCV